MEKFSLLREVRRDSIIEKDVLVLSPCPFQQGGYCMYNMKGLRVSGIVEELEILFLDGVLDDWASS